MVSHRRSIDKVVLAPDIITITGPIKPLEIAASGDPEHQKTIGVCQLASGALLLSGVMSVHLSVPRD